MIFGFGIFGLGYAVFYWGQHHFVGDHYSLWCLVGLNSLFKAKGGGLFGVPGPNGLPVYPAPANAPGGIIPGSGTGIGMGR